MFDYDFALKLLHAGHHPQRRGWNNAHLTLWLGEPYLRRAGASGPSTGSLTPFDPTEEDKIATDWQCQDCFGTPKYPPPGLGDAALTNP